MNVQLSKWGLEVISISISIVISALVVLPIWSAGIKSDWMIYNLVFLFVAMTIVRYLFFFEYHPFGASKIFKISLICLVPVFIFPIIEGIHSFTEFHDREGLQSLMSHLSPERQTFFTTYMKTEYLLAGMTCFLGVFALIIKMIRSLWRQVKYNVV